MYNNNNKKLLQKLLWGEAGQLYPFLFYFLLFRGVCIQFPISPWGRISSCIKRGMEYHGCGEEYKVDKRKRGIIFYDIEAVWKNIKSGKGEGTEI